MRSASALLACWIFVLSLAGVSPALHDWLHADSGCASQCESHPAENDAPTDNEGHYCGVIALQGSLMEVVDALPSTHQIVVDLEYREWISAPHSAKESSGLHARAPPIEIKA